MQTGDQTTDEVATGLRVADIEGQKGNRLIGGTWYNNTLHNMTITIAPRAGSRDIDLDEAVVELSDTSNKVILTWDGSTHSSSVSNSGVFSTTVFDLGADDFGIIVLEDADSSCGSSNPVINRGDQVMLTVNLTACFSGLSERTDIWGMVIPEEGAPGVFAFRTPASYASDTVYDLY
jgi:flagellin FlaB